MMHVKKGIHQKQSQKKTKKYNNRSPCKSPATDMETGEMHLTSPTGGSIIGNNANIIGMNNNDPFKLF